MSENKVKWHPYPQEKPNEKDTYIVTLKFGKDLLTSITDWIPEQNTFWDFGDSVVAWAELPEPYKENENI